MALATKDRVLVADVPAFQATMSTGGGPDGAGRGRLETSSRPLPPESSGAVHEIEGSVRETPTTKQMSADVLVVDDDADVRWTVAEILRSAGFSVAEAEDGEIALALLRTERYRMVLLDLRMPKRDGASVIEALGEVPPVVVHSAYAVEAAERDRLGSRVVDYLHKPVSPQKLLRAVESVLGAGG
jgi:two-component system chemotaxis response regulator CheY